MSANFAPLNSLKNTAVASLSSISARCNPKQILVPAPNGEKLVDDGDVFGGSESQRHGLNLYIKSALPRIDAYGPLQHSPLSLRP